ncbi:MAG: hypothetical protein RLZZ237_3459 [Pseudomonadota bacterium]
MMLPVFQTSRKSGKCQRRISGAGINERSPLRQHRFAQAQAHEKGRRSALSNDHLSCLLHQFLDDFDGCAAIAEELLMKILQHELAAQRLLALFAQVHDFAKTTEIAGQLN